MSAENVELVRRWFEGLGRGELTLEICDPEIEIRDWLIDVGDDRVVTVQRFVGRFRLTGIEVDFVWGAVVTISEGRIASAIGYPSPGRAKKAAGLSRRAASDS
jgi:hypothetical protein